ncbi:hypothetical protein L3Y34_005285 [Caenorhabditis briggsae]|uniref:Uncharacterized protein n=1 Tax=Caenorhabditis briggsae TaxID=6238 RepID=A0AAE9AE40_CAEBR|nr:hypothetical protein L3Y34_005285 [Caenorhabditis briggsae]
MDMDMVDHHIWPMSRRRDGENLKQCSRMRQLRLPRLMLKLLRSLRNTMFRTPTMPSPPNTPPISPP